MEFFVTMKENTFLEDTWERKLFFKKYTCFDGVDSFYFTTRKEAMKYVINRSRIIKNSLDFSLSQFSVISKFYIDNLFRCRKYNYKSSLVNEYLRDSLIVINYLMSSKCKIEYVLPKTIYLLQRYKQVTDLLGYLILFRLVCKYLDSLIIEYPVFESLKLKKEKCYENVIKKVV
jgi:hypothetical protein